jgi:hypothetical protein
MDLVGVTGDGVSQPLRSQIPNLDGSVSGRTRQQRLRGVHGNDGLGSRTQTGPISKGGLGSKATAAVAAAAHVMIV